MKKRKWTGGIPFKLRVGIGADAVVFEGNALSRDFDESFRLAYNKVKGAPDEEFIRRLRQPVTGDEEKEAKKDESR